MKKILNIALVVLVVLVTTGCFKKVTHNTTVVVKCLTEDVSGGERVPTEYPLAYAYYVGSEDWTINSYEDAVNFVVTSTVDDTVLTEPNVMGTHFEKYETPNYVAMYLTQTISMIVVADPATKMYAWLFKRLEAENLKETYLTLIFHSWKDKDYTEGSKAGATWYVKVPPKDNPEPPVTPDVPVTPDEGDEDTPTTPDEGSGDNEDTPVTPEE